MGALTLLYHLAMGGNASKGWEGAEKTIAEWVNEKRNQIPAEIEDPKDPTKMPNTNWVKTRAYI